MGQLHLVRKHTVEWERFTNRAMGAARTSASFLTRTVGIGSRDDDFAGQDHIKSSISSVVTSLKAMREALRRKGLGSW
jgi:hypothetical protein